MAREPKTDFHKIIKKAALQAENYCRICGKDIYPDDTALFATTKRKSICLFHIDCVVKEARATKHKKTLHFTEAII